MYNGTQPAGYAAEPAETVNYVSCHDGEVLFDQLIMKPHEQVGRRPTAALIITSEHSDPHRIIRIHIGCGSGAIMSPKGGRAQPAAGVAAGVMLGVIRGATTNEVAVGVRSKVSRDSAST